MRRFPAHLVRPPDPVLRRLPAHLLRLPSGSGVAPASSAPGDGGRPAVPKARLPAGSNIRTLDLSSDQHGRGGGQGAGGRQVVGGTTVTVVQDPSVTTAVVAEAGREHSGQTPPEGSSVAGASRCQAGVGLLLRVRGYDEKAVLAVSQAGVYQVQGAACLSACFPYGVCCSGLCGTGRGVLQVWDPVL